MYSIIKAKLTDITKIKNILKKANLKEFNILSNYNWIVFKEIIMKNVFIIVERKNKKTSHIAVVLMNRKTKELFYFSGKKLSFTTLYSILKSNTSFSNYKLNARYINFSLKDIMENRIFDIVKDFKCMSIETYKEKHLIHKNLEVKTMKIDKEEKARVELQNNIFNNIAGRRELTLKEVYNEERSNGFIVDMCFFLTLEGIKIGYGQILHVEGNYYLVNFGVLQEYRGNGYASDFLDAIIMKCSENGLEKLLLTVDNFNLPAVNLYQKHGFKEEYNFCIIKI